ncbi:MAG: YihY/virulence factor BrkB family protein [Roseiflexaceae bacterium]
MQSSDILPLIKGAFSDWNEDKAPRLAAAVAYYTVFSLAPLLVIVIAIAGLVFGEEAARGALSNQIEGLVGSTGAQAIEEMIKGASHRESGIIATVIGIVTLLFGASGLFGQLQDALNTIWEVQPKPGQGIVATLKQRFFSFTMVLGTGFLLLVSLVVSAALAGVVQYFQGFLPGADWIWQVVNFVIGLAVTTLLFALIFKIIPDAEIAWSDVWIGAAATAVLFSVGRLLLGLYLGRSSFGSTYGAAGSFVVLLIWIYYSAQILFLGAEFTQVYANRFGSRVKPSPNAVALTDQDRAQQGIPRKEQVEAAVREREVGGLEREVGGADPGRVPAPAASTPEREHGPVTTGLAGFIAGLLVGRRQRQK